MRWWILPICIVIVNAPVISAQDKRPSWVEPMRKVHAGFSGDKHYVAQFGDSITTSLAFWSPLGWDDPEKYLPDDRLPKKPGEQRWRDVILGTRDKGAQHGNDGGWRVGNIVAVIDKVLKDKRPAVAVIMVGTNDISGDRVPDDYAAGMAKIVDKCLAAQCIPMLTTIPPRRGHDKSVAAANEIVRKLAEEKQLPLIDYHAAILERRPEDTWDKTLISGDGVHPSAMKTNDYSEANLQQDGYALRNWVTFQKYREVYFYVLHPDQHTKK